LREIKEKNGLKLFNIGLFCEQSFSEKTKMGPLKKRQGTIHYYSAKFDGNLENIRIKEGVGFGVFDELELKEYDEFGLIVPDNYDVIEAFYESLKK